MVLNSFNISEGTRFRKYLGFPIFTSRPTKADFPLLENFKPHIIGWPILIENRSGNSHSLNLNYSTKSYYGVHENPCQHSPEVGALSAQLLLGNHLYTYKAPPFQLRLGPAIFLYWIPCLVFGELPKLKILS